MIASDSSADRNPVEILADQFAQRLRAGEHPTIDEYVVRYPEHASLIRDIFPTIEMIERASERKQTDDETDAPLMARFRLSKKTLGDFDIIRETGRGGMGVVYEAQQRSLNRRVALKLLGPAVADSPAHLARFQREAEAAARLHHTNIVPVFGTGTDDGFYFYVMQFIDGVALSEVVHWLGRPADPDSPIEGVSCQVVCPAGARLPSETQFTAAEAAAILLDGTVQDRSSVRGSSARSATTVGQSTDSVRPPAHEPRRSAGDFAIDNDGDSPKANGGDMQSAERTEAQDPCTADTGTPHSMGGSYWRNVAQIGVDIAGALSYSHQQGVLHRDIKPSNVLLDRDGIIWVADFGLAKHQDQEGITNADDLVGTLRYMAPEQFQGQTDNRSDIYSLGLTLYELLTFQPAFGETRHGPLIQQKIAATPPSPRRAEPQIPRDLDTIVVKACATEPAHRYQSAAELAADLQRFLDDRPIHARRFSPIESLWRWARRNPWIATLAASTALFLAATAVVFLIGQHRTEQALALLAGEKERVDRALQQVGQEKERVEEENIRAEANLRVAIEAFEEIAKNISSRGAPLSLAVVPGEEISAVTPADAELLERMLAFFDQFAEYNRIDFAAESAAALKRVGDIHQQLGRLDAAEKAYREGFVVYERLIEQGQSTEEHTLEAARILNAMAGIHSRRGNISSAVDAHRKARDLLEAQEPGGSAALRLELAKTLIQRHLVSEIAGLPTDSPASRSGRGGPGMPTDPPASKSGRGGPPRRGRGGGAKHGRGREHGRDGLDDCDAAIDILESLVAEAPSAAEYRLALAQAYRTRVRVLLMAKQTEDAKASLQTAVASLEQLTVDYSNSPAILYELADALRTQVVKDQEYGERIRRSVQLSGELTATHPSILPYQALAGECLGQLAALDFGNGELDAAVANYEQAVAHLRPLADRLDSVLPAQLSYARTLADFAEVHIRRSQISDARANP